MRWQDYVDIAIVAVLTYLLLVRIRGTKAFQIVIGIVVLFGLNFLTRWTGLYVTSWVFQYLWAVILLGLIILFQPEIRRMLEEVSPLKMIKGWGKGADSDIIRETAEAASALAVAKLGAILVFPRMDSLEEFIQGGVTLDAVVSKPLILNIFHPPSPLHDGAAIVRRGRIERAGCFLPMTESHSVPQRLGSRHRAAIGLTERTDAVCLVVSEERGDVSLCNRGKIRSCLDSKDVEERLERLIQLQRKKRDSGDWKHVVLGNLWSKVFAVAFAFFLWGTISGARTSEISLTSTIELFGIPEKMALSETWGGQVSVRIKGSRGLLAGVSSDKIRVRLNLSNAKPGTNFVTLTPDDLNLPPGIQITSIKPSVVKIVLEEIESRTYRVQFQLSDSPPPGIKIVTVKVEPEEIKLEAPKSQLRKIEKVVIEPISLSEFSTDKKVVRPVQIVPSTVLLSQKELPKVTVTIVVGKAENAEGKSPPQDAQP